MKKYTENPFFSVNGRITVEPYTTDIEKNNDDFVKIIFYKISGMYTYAIQAQMHKRIFAKYPHPQDEIFDSIQECRNDAKKVLKNWTDQNRLKKCFNRIAPAITDQPGLFDDLD